MEDEYNANKTDDGEVPFPSYRGPAHALLSQALDDRDARPWAYYRWDDDQCCTFAYGGMRCWLHKSHGTHKGESSTHEIPAHDPVWVAREKQLGYIT